MNNRGVRPGTTLVVAAEELRRAIESRTLFGFAVFFAACVLGLSFFGQSQGGDVGFTGFARVTLSLLNLMLFVVPLVGLLLGVSSVTGSLETLSLLLAQPVSREEVLFGKFLGLGAAIVLAESVGLGAGGVVIAASVGTAQLAGFAVLCGLSFLLGLVSLAASLALSAWWPDRLKATGAALGLWLLSVVGYDLIVVGATSMLRGLPLERILMPALLLNPVDLTRVLVTLAVGQGALFGPTAATLVRTLGTAGGVGIALAALVAQGVVPLVLAQAAFRRRDW
jgi:Cu-processing system permease protein